MVYLHLPYFIPELIEVTDERTTDLLKDINVKDALFPRFINR